MGGDVKFKDRSPLLQSYDSRSLGLAWNRRSMSISCSLINLRLRQMAMMVLTIFGLFSSIYVIYLLYFSYMDYVEKLAIDEVLPPQKWDFEESPHLKSTEVEANFIEWQKDYFNRSVNPHLRCGEFFDDYNNETRKSYVEAGRMTLPEEKLNFSMDCNSIRRRIFGNTFFTKSDRPLAYSRLVYRSYALQEALLSMSYHPDDWYCYAIDQKASCRFKSEMKVLGACLDNVIVLDEEFDLNSSGRDYNRGGLACFEKLRAKDWFHVMSLQNNDMIVKTHEEMVAVSKFLNISSNTGSEPPKRERYHPEADWSPKGLKLFKNESKVSQLIFEKHFTIRKFYDEVILSRSFVDAVFENIDFTIFLKQMAETGLYGVDEMFWPTIFMNQLGLPGQLENPKCHGNVDGITRHSIFKVGRKITSGPFWECKSKWLRHSICVLGVEYLPEIDRATELHMNKPLGEFDFGTVICTAEMLHNRTKGLRKSTFNETYYRNLPEVVELNSKRDGRITRCLGNQLEDFLSAGLSHFSIASLLLISLVPNFDLI